MDKDGKVVTILNPKQLLVEILNSSAFTVGREFIAFEQRDLPAGAVGPSSVELPKPGRLVVVAIQRGEQYALLGLSPETRRVVQRRPTQIARDLLGVINLNEEIETEEPTGVRGKLATDVAVGIEANPTIAPGDFVSAS